MKLKQLESMLQDVKVFEDPKVQLEQYSTPPHIAAHMLHSIHTRYNDIEGKIVADLGCGCGVLSIGSAILGAGLCLGLDVDEDAIKRCRDNLIEFEVDNVDLVQADINHFPVGNFKKIDTVLMNPPFGTRNEGIDTVFLKTALDLASSVYTLHKTSTRKYLYRTAKKWDVSVEVIAELKFDLPKSYEFHKHTSRDIEVDFIRFSHSKSRQHIKHE